MNIANNLVEFFKHKSNIQLLGVFFDITGAFYLSRAFIFKKPADIKTEVYGSSNQKFLISFGMSGNLFISFYTQGIEAKIGFFLLFFGFLFQGMGIIWPYILVRIFIVLIIWGMTTVICEYLCRKLTSPIRVAAILNRDEREFDDRLKNKKFSK